MTVFKFIILFCLIKFDSLFGPKTEQFRNQTVTIEKGIMQHVHMEILHICCYLEVFK